MTPEESGRPERPELLLVFVDIANIRPRAKPGNTSNLSGSPTSLAYIDLCLHSIQITAPGAIVIQFADESLLSAVSYPDREEIIRRAELHYTEPDKIFLVKYADRPILAGAHHFEATIISCDNFDDPDLDLLKTSSARQYRHQFDRADKLFAFPAKNGGSTLDQWWKLEFDDVPDTWFVSEEYVEIEWILRSNVHDITFEYHSEPLTHRPPVSIEAVRKLHTKASSDTRKSNSTKEPARTNKRSTAPVVFLDDTSTLVKLNGADVLAVGRFSTEPEGRRAVQWFGGGVRAMMPARPQDQSIPDGSWVSLPCRIDISGDVINLAPLNDDPVSALTFGQVLDMRAKSDRDRVEIKASGHWKLPGLTRSVVNVVRLRERREARRTRARSSIPELPDRRSRRIPVFRDGRIEYEMRESTAAEQAAAADDAQSQFEKWKLNRAAKLNAKRRKDEDEQERLDQEHVNLLDTQKATLRLTQQNVEKRKRDLEKRKEEQDKRLKELQQENHARKARGPIRKHVPLLIALILCLLVVVTVALSTGAISISGMVPVPKEIGIFLRENSGT